MLTNDEVLQIFKDSGALLEGHFLLASGYHSAVYLEKFQVLQFPRYVEMLCKDIAEKVRGRRGSGGDRPDHGRRPAGL